MSQQSRTVHARASPVPNVRRRAWIDRKSRPSRRSTYSSFTTRPPPRKQPRWPSWSVATRRPRESFLRQLPARKVVRIYTIVSHTQRDHSTFFSRLDMRPEICCNHMTFFELVLLCRPVALFLRRVCSIYRPADAAVIAQCSVSWISLKLFNFFFNRFFSWWCDYPLSGETGAVCVLDRVFIFGECTFHVNTQCIFLCYLSSVIALALVCA